MQIPQVHGFSVSDSPDYFYDDLDRRVLAELSNGDLAVPARSLLEIVDAKGRGYAKASPDDVAVISRVARETGIVLDPTYSGART